ncbi:MAG: hypothetical protein ACKVOH_01155 [Chlamydiales bacterium]
MKRVLSFIFAGCICWGVIQGYNTLTDGFSLQQMKSQLPLDSRFDPPPLPQEEKQKLQHMIAQKFRYIGKGCQFYAFASEDGKWVIKFLKQKHLKPWTELQQIPMPRQVREHADRQIRKRQERVENLFFSCQLAYSELSEESGLLYIHLNRVPGLEREVTLIDKMGLHHRVNVDEYEFILQRRARSVKEVFAAASKEEIGEKIDQLISLVHSRCSKGIRDRDRSFVQNVAFYEKGALFIDIGQFYKDETILAKEEEQKDLKRRLGNLRYWTEKNFPQYLHDVEKRLADLTEASTIH